MHRYRNLILLGLLAAIPLIGAIVLANVFLSGEEADPVRTAQPQQQPAPRAPVTRKVIVADRNLEVGTLLGDGDLGTLDMEQGKIRRRHILVEGSRTVEAFRGYAMREPLSPGAPLTWSAIIGPGQRGFLAAALRPGTRAVTIQLGKGTRHAGLVDPGDRVDVILTARLRLPDGAKTVFTRTILEDVRVVAVDRRIESADTPKKKGEKLKRSEIVTATLEVAPAQAGRLALGAHEGTLSVAVRSLASAPRQSGNRAVDLEQLMSSPEDRGESVVASGGPGARGGRLEPWKKVRVFRGDKVSVEKFADPSRSEDSAVPGQ
ncbi:MAG: Flp pilus assembly protein CpaB [Defluviicoccus sp.]|nr:Flp pilus assembly protein CpaB [Defluviicoccus sp.]MDE0382395.1 Flp pilus assembly protein CpaB [Defluviicoccus sp.]